MTFNDKQSGYEELLVKANLPSLYNRCIQDILILMYKVKLKLLRLLPQTIYDLFTLSTSPYNIRNADFILPPIFDCYFNLESTPFATLDLNYGTNFHLKQEISHP